MGLRKFLPMLQPFPPPPQVPGEANPFNPRGNMSEPMKRLFEVCMRASLNLEMAKLPSPELHWIFNQVSKSESVPFPPFQTNAQSCCCQNFLDRGQSLVIPDGIYRGAQRLGPESASKECFLSDFGLLGRSAPKSVLKSAFGTFLAARNHLKALFGATFRPWPCAIL